MTTRARLQNSNDSKSLWNYTLSPGWGVFDAHILRLAIMKYGCGSWRQIGRHFPLKGCGQLNLQTQRLFGQQALAEFSKVHIDPNRLKVENDKIEGFRKNTCLINTGNNLTLEQLKKKKAGHTEKYGIPKEVSDKIVVPVVLDPPAPCDTLIDEIEKLREMYRCVYDIQLRLKQLRQNGGKNAANISVKIKSKKKENETKKVVEETNDVQMNDKGDENKNNHNEKEPVAVDQDVAMAMALSMSMQDANINTPAIEKKAKRQTKKKTTAKKGKKGTAKKKSTRKSSKKSAKKNSKKRKKMDDDEEFVPGPAKKRVKTN